MSVNSTATAEMPPRQLFTNPDTGLRTSYCLRLGAARPPLVFFHGFNGGAHSWVCQFREFSDRTLLAVDAPGYGGSDVTVPDMQVIARNVDALLRHLNLTPAIIVGHSMGGMLAQVLAATYPEHVAGLVLSCTFKGRGGPPDAPLPEAVEQRLKERASMDDAAFGTLRTEKMVPTLARGPIFDLLAEVAGAIPAPAIECGGLTMERLDTSDLLGDIVAPTLILTAEQDAVVVPAAGQALIDGLPKAKVTQLSGVGHAPYCEDAAAFNAAVQEMIDTVEAAAAR